MQKDKLIAFIIGVLPIPRSKAEEIVSHFQYKEVAKNEFILQEGRVCNDYYFIEEGFARAFTFDTEANDISTGFFSGNQVLFEVASFFMRTPSRENIQALEHCHTWFITYDQLQHLFHSIPEFREFGRAILVNGYVSFKQRTLSMINETAEHRYETLMKTRPEIFQKASLKTIASYLGITDTSLSRIRKELSGKH